MGRSGSGKAAGSDRSRFVRAWARAIGGVNFVPMSPGELELSLGRLLDRLLATLVGEPFRADPAREVGADLVAAHVVSPEAFGRTIALIGTELVACVAEPIEGLDGRVAALLGELAIGYTHALHLRTLDDQERARTALAAVPRPCPP